MNKLPSLSAASSRATGLTPHRTAVALQQAAIFHEAISSNKLPLYSTTKKNRPGINQTIPVDIT
jgi:hypothetical protein